MSNEQEKIKKLLEESNEEYQARKKLLDTTAPDDSRAGGDAALGSSFRHNPVGNAANFDKKVYLFPDSFNALRRELEENWQDFFHTVVPDLGYSPAVAMVFEPQQFIGFCNGFTGLTVQFDSENVDGICKQFLNAFRKMRGVGAIN